MTKKKIQARLFHFIQEYGFNAVLGFGLGIAIVFVVFAIYGKQDNLGIESGEGGIAQAARKQIVSQEQVDSEIGEVAGDFQKDPADDLMVDLADEYDLKDNFTVLLIGMDNRPGEIISNTDTLIVASLDSKNKKMVLLSIPRDTQVILQGKKEKINAVARLGKGAVSTQQYIQELLGTSIDGYVLTNFQGFKNIVDSLGGITINVEKDMYYDTGDDQDRYINLKKGNQRLNGSQALQYARFRNDELADISRVSRQQEVIKSIVAEASTPRNLPKLPIIIPKVYQAIETNLNLGQVWSLAMAFKNKETYQVINQTLPGQFSDEEGISYWLINPKESKGIVSRLLQGHTKPIFENIKKVEAPVKNPVNSPVEEKIQMDNEDSSITVEILTIVPKEDLKEKTETEGKTSKKAKKKNEPSDNLNTPTENRVEQVGEKSKEEITFEVLE